jgi:hypothetical protein
MKTAVAAPSIRLTVGLTVRQQNVQINAEVFAGALTRLNAWLRESKQH